MLVGNTLTAELNFLSWLYDNSYVGVLSMIISGTLNQMTLPLVKDVNVGKMAMHYLLLRDISGML